MGRAEQIFEQYVDGGLKYLRSLLNCAIETEVQDFKLATAGMDANAK